MSTNPSAVAVAGKTINSETTTNTGANNNIPVHITRIKLLKQMDTLVLGHVYRLITTQEVMKGLWAKKYSKMKQQQLEYGDKSSEKSTNSHSMNGIVRRSDLDNSKQAFRANNIDSAKSRFIICAHDIQK